MRRLAIIYMSLVILITIFGYTSSYFSDVEVISGNTFQAGSAQIADHLVISEVQTKGDGETNHDFVEIYNPTDQPINLSDYKSSYVKLVKYSSSGGKYSIKSWWHSSDVIIPAHGFYLWASNKDGNYPSYLGADCNTSFTISDNNAVSLEFPNGTIIDLVGWGSCPVNESSAFPFNPENNQSLERKAQTTSTNETMKIGGFDEFLGNGQDTDDNSNDFVLRESSQPQNSSFSENPPWPPS